MKHKFSWQTIPLVPLATLLVTGIAVGDYADRRLSLRSWAVLCLVTLVATLWTRHRMGRSVGILLLTAAVGGWLVTRKNAAMHPALPQGRCHYEAVVEQPPTAHGQVVFCDLRIEAIEGQHLRHPLKVRASLHGDNERALQYRPGTVVQGYSALQPPRQFATGGHFDYVRWMHVQGYVATTFVPVSDIGRTTDAPRLSWRARVHQWRRQWAAQLAQAGLQDDARALVTAMTLGDKSLLSRELKTQYSVAGVSHVLALSGLHLSIIFMVLLLLTGRTLAGRVASLSAIWVYAVLVGLGPSVVRSATMLTIYTAVSALHRDAVSLNTLALAAIVMLGLNPLLLWDVGFELSFLSVAAIVTLYKPLFNSLHPQHPLLRRVWALLCISAAAQLSTAPLVMYYFGRFPCYFLLTNLVVVPCATVLLYAACLLLLCGWIPPVRMATVWCMDTAARAMNGVAEQVARWPGAGIERIKMSNLQVVLLYVIVVGCCLLATFRPWRQLGTDEK